MVPGAFSDAPQSGGPVAAAAAMIELMQQMPSEQEFVHTAQMVQFVAQPALVQVVRSLLEDFPFLVPHVRVRCDQSMANFLQQQQQQQQHGGSSQMFTGSGAATPFMQSPDRGFGHAQATPSNYGRSPAKAYHADPHGGSASASPAHGTSPGGTRTGKRNGRVGSSRAEEEQDLCQRHGNMRAVKHLTYNAANRRVECVPGFHCLETRAIPAAAPTGAVSIPPGVAAAASLSASKQPSPVPQVTPPASGAATPRSMATPSAPGGGALLSAHASVPTSPSKVKAAAAAAAGEGRSTPMLQGTTPPPVDTATTAESARLQALLSDLQT
jgi:hypothetical protein